MPAHLYCSTHVVAVRTGALLLALLVALPALAQETGAEVQPDPQPTDVAAPEGQEQSGEESEPTPTHKSGYDKKPPFAGPRSPQGQAEADDRVKKPAMRMGGFDGALDPWFAWKRQVNKEYGLQISGHYVAFYQGLSESLGDEDEAASGLFRLTTRWALTGRESGNEGALVLTVDQRHAYTDLAPAGLAGEAGYLGVTGLMFSDFGAAIIYLNWNQSFNDGRTGLLVGRFDPNDYMTVLGYASPWTGFQNLAILLDPSIAFPDSSWGVGAGSWLDDNWWILGSVNDANGFGSDDLEFFVGGAELFSQVSFGWSPSKDERYFTSLNATVWHVDERQDAGIPASEGISLAGNRTWNQTWMAFFRAGFSDGAAPIYNRSAMAGFIRYFAYRSDLVGLAVSWGEPPDDALAAQTTIEGFYRFQLAQNLAVTPSVQYLLEPAFNSQDDEVWLVGLRARFTF